MYFTIGSTSSRFRKKLAIIYDRIESAAISKNFGTVITSEVSVTMRGMNLVAENATQPVIKVANIILLMTFQKSRLRIFYSDFRCNINSNMIISIIAPIDCAKPNPSTPQPNK